MTVPQDPQVAELTMVRRRLERERRARLDAEAIAEQALRDVYQKHEALLRATAERERLETEHDAKFRAEQLRVVQVTMRTVHDIVNNCLNQLQLLRFDAEGHVPEESLAFFDAAIEDTAAKLKALGDLETFAEKQMASGVGLSLDARSTTSLG